MAEPTTPPADPTLPASGNGGTPPAPTPPATPPADKLFSQVELEAVIKDRLERQQRALDAKAASDKAAAEAAKLAEQGEFKKLAEAAQQEAATLKAQLAQRDHVDLQRTVAAEHNLPANLALRLQGTTREELVADAKELAKVITAPPPPPTPGNRPGPRPQSAPDVAKATEDALRATGRYNAI